MSYTPNEFLPNISRGRVAGASPFLSYGKRVAIGAESNVLWGDGLYTIPPAGGVQMSVVSSSANDTAAGTGIRTLRIVYLDNNLVTQSEIITMNGLVPVLTVATNIRFIQYFHMTTVGTNKSSVGNITISNGGVTYGYMPTGSTIDNCSMKMVPAGKKIFIDTIVIGAISGGAAAGVLLQFSQSSFDGYDLTSQSAFFGINSLAISDASFSGNVDCPLPFTAGQVFGFTFSTDKAATVTGILSGWIENA